MPVRRAPPLDRRDAGALLLLATLALVLRLVALDADPSLEVFRGLLTDEGAWAHNARQAVVFGRWVMDDHNPGLTIAPVYSGALWLGYTMQGVDFVSTRLVAALSGALLALGAWAWVRRATDPRTALLAGGLLAVGSFGLVHQRIATVEPLQSLFLLAAAAGVVHAGEGGRRARLAAAAAAAALWLAVATKLTAVALAPAIVLYALWRLAVRDEAAGRGLPPRRWGPALAFAATALAGLAVVAALAAAHPDVTAELVGNLRSARSPRPAETLHLHVPGLPAAGLPYGSFLRLCGPMLAVVALLGAARLADGRRAPIGGLETFCWSWLLAVLGFVAVQAYQPERRFLAALPALAILAALASRPGALTVPAREATSRPRLAAAGALLGALLGAYAHEAAGRGGDPAATGLAARLLAASIVLGAVVGALLPAVLPRRRVPLPRPAVALLFVAIFAVDGARIVREAASLSWGVRDTR
ncbi:MAG: glycosyltransferase family 39 protein, partial [Myxococcota bacterium]|nr:glycosyltransferase family 39 protein [Myxococcota bacterium]